MPESTQLPPGLYLYNVAADGTINPENFKTVEAHYSEIPAELSDLSSCVNVFLDTSPEGESRIYIRWDFQQSTRTDLVTGTSYPEYSYKEKLIKWTPPPFFMSGGVKTRTKVLDENGDIVKEATRANIIEYVRINAEEIVGYAQDAYDMKECQM
jgi:hypothetical protein